MIKRAGNYNIETAELKTRNSKVNIANQIDSIQIFESIDQPFMTGTIVIHDLHDIQSSLPLMGDEELRLILETPGVDVIDRNFFVYKLSDMLRVGVSKKVYALHFVSIEMRAQSNRKISKAYSGEITEIVSELVQELEPEIEVLGEETTLNAKYISPYWSPIRNINHCCMLAENENKSSSYVFFENRLGFNFTSFDSLYSLEPAFEWVSDLYNRRGGTENLDETMKSVESYRVINSYNTLEATNQGAFASTRTFFDPLKRVYREQPYDYFDLFSEFSHLNEYPITSNKFFRSPEAKRSNEFEFTNKFLDQNIEKSDKQIRASQLFMLDNQKLEIEVLGRMDYTVGLTAYLTIYSNKPVKRGDGIEDHIDPVLTGRYLISSINHIFTREDHRCVVEIVKESRI